VGVGEAAAQGMTWSDRLFVNVSVAGGGRSTNPTVTSSFTIYQETATVTSTWEAKPGVLFDFTVGRRLYRNFGAAFNFSSSSASGDATVEGSIPDPITPVHPRTVSATVPGLDHSEKLFAFLAVYVYPATDKIDVFLMAGPVVANVKHDVVSSATVTGEIGTPPNLTPQLAYQTTTLSKSVWGFQIGADVRYMFTKQIGAGVFVRSNVAAGDLTDTIPVDVGGFQAGGGLRVRF
jgi:hypothetical protein